MMFNFRRLSSSQQSQYIADDGLSVCFHGLHVLIVYGSFSFVTRNAFGFLSIVPLTSCPSRSHRNGK